MSSSSGSGCPRRLRDFYLARGVTTVYDMSSPDVAHKIYQELNAKGQLPVRLRLNYIVGANDLNGGKSDTLAALLRDRVRPESGDDWIRIGALKIILDGVWGTTAAVYRPAWEGSGTTWTANNVGGVSRTQDVLNKQIVEGHKAGWQIWVHANGDRAQDMVLTAYEAAQQAMPRPDARHRIEHFAHFLTQDASRTGRAARADAPRKDHPRPAGGVSLAADRSESRGTRRQVLRDGNAAQAGASSLGRVRHARHAELRDQPVVLIAAAVNRKTKYGEVGAAR